MNYLKGAVTLGLLVGLSGVSQAVWAGCYFKSDAPVAYRQKRTEPWNVPISALVYNKNQIPSLSQISPGQAIGNPIVIHSGGQIDYQCTASLAHPIQFGYYSRPMVASDYPGVYKTNVPGIGFKISDVINDSAAFNNGVHLWYTFTWMIPVGSPGRIEDTSGGFHLNKRLQIQFYAIGPISPGEIKLDAVLDAWVGGLYSYKVPITSNLSLVRGGCRTPDIRVDLKNHSSATFPKYWATSPETPFNFELNECEPGMNAVSYTFKPATGINLVAANSIHQYLTLTSNSTAKGVGVQVMNGDDTMVKFNEKIKFTGYNKASGGSYRIPMKARYSSVTWGTITPGTANSAMEFIMHYE